MAADIPEASIVLGLGPIDPELSRLLEGRACRVVAMPAADLDGEGLDLADVGHLDLGRARFDVIIADDVLGRVRRPEELLDALRVALRPGGRLVATVPNAAHRAVLSALEQGRDPYGDPAPIDPGQLRLFTRESFAVMLDQAGFAVGRLIAVDAPQEGSASEATSWRAVAYPLPIPGLDTIQALFRETALERDAAEREVVALRDVLACMGEAIDSAHRRAASLLEREQATREAMLEAQAALLHRDEEFRATTRDLLRRIEEIEPLRRERDAAHRHALAAEARCRALELRIEHVLMEYPRRVARKARAILRGR